MTRVEDAPVKRRRRTPVRDPKSDAYRGTDEWRDNISSGMQDAMERRKAANRERNRERDAEMVRRYREDERTIRELAVEFGLNFRTILTVLHRARDDGYLVMRPAAVRIRS